MTREQKIRAQLCVCLCGGGGDEHNAGGEHLKRDAFPVPPLTLMQCLMYNRLVRYRQQVEALGKYATVMKEEWMEEDRRRG